MVYFDHILHTYVCQYDVTTGMCGSLFDERGLLSIISASCGQSVKMLITLEPHGIYGSNFAYLFIFTLFKVTGMRNGDEALPSNDLAGRGLLVKILITLEPFSP